MGGRALLALFGERSGGFPGGRGLTNPVEDAPFSVKLFGRPFIDGVNDCFEAGSKLFGSPAASFEVGNQKYGVYGGSGAARGPTHLPQVAHCGEEVPGRPFA
eukprot:5142181-Heterocapsa_arctica.AAC.1